MSKKVLVSLDMNKNEVQNVVMQSLATAPTSPKEGQYYYNSADKKAYRWNGSAWKPLGGAEITVDTELSSTSTNPVQNKAVNDALEARARRSQAVGDIAFSQSGANNYSVSWSSVDDGDLGEDAINAATQEKAGVMTAEDKKKLDGLSNLTVDSELNVNSTNPVQNKRIATALANKVDKGAAVTDLVPGTRTATTASINGLADDDLITNAALEAATQTYAGLMSAADKTKLDGMADYVKSVIGDLPKEQFLDLTKTKFVQSFAWSSTTYPGSTNPSLEGKPVLVLALKNSSDNTVAYSFLNMYELVDTYTADSPIKVSGRKITHETSGVSAGSYGQASNATPAFGDTFNVPYITENVTGHATKAETHTVKIPDATATKNAAGLMSASDKTNLDAMKNKTDSMLALKKAELVIDPSNTSETVQLSVSSPTILSVEAMYHDDSKGDGSESVIVDWECDGPTFKASIAQAETQLSIWIYVLYI